MLEQKKAIIPNCNNIKYELAKLKIHCKETHWSGFLSIKKEKTILPLAFFFLIWCFVSIVDVLRIPIRCMKYEAYLGCTSAQLYVL